MQADAFYFEVAAVEPETSVSIEMKFPDPERHNLIIDCCLSVAQPRHNTIKVWMIQVPPLRILYDEVLRETHRRTSVDILRLGFGGLYHSPRRVEHLYLDGPPPWRPCLVGYFV